MRIAVGNSLMTINPTLRYSDDVRRECLKMYVNGMGFRGIEREIAGGIIPPATLSRGHCVCIIQR